MWYILITSYITGFMCPFGTTRRREWRNSSISLFKGSRRCVYLLCDELVYVLWDFIFIAYEISIL